MTQSKRQGKYSLMIWGFVALGFTATFFSNGGPSTYAQESVRILISAIFLAFGFAGYGIMLYMTRAKPGNAQVIEDERDSQIAIQASQTGFITVLIYVFLTCIILWESHRSETVVPVGWMWFLAYSTAIVGYLSHAVTMLILNMRMEKHGES
jgi:uncharacterized membrane protein